jgi:hypothetical protein
MERVLGSHWLWVVIIDCNCNRSTNKSSHPIQNPLLLVTQIRGNILACDAMKSGENLSTFQKNILSPICVTRRTFGLVIGFIEHFRLFIHQWHYRLLLGPGLFFSFVIFKTAWTSDQPFARPLPKHRTTQTQNKRTHKHTCLGCDWNPQSHRSSERRHFMH